MEQRNPRVKTPARGMAPLKSRSELKADWLNWFKLAVTQARDARLKGEMNRACHLDQVVDRYFAEGEEHGFTEDELFEIESDIRNKV